MPTSSDQGEETAASREGKGPAPAICLVGRSSSGKTTLIEKLIPELKRRGYRVGTIKHHSHPGFEIDVPGKDTWRHAQAGSDHVIIAAPDKIASIRRPLREPDFAGLIALMDDVDIVLVEGFKRAGTWRIEIVRAERSVEPICLPEELIAVVTDVDLALDLPTFGLEEIAGLADLIEERFLRSRP